MIILSHRGYWQGVQEKNVLSAFNRSFSLAFGTETDLRDRNGELVISHDPAREDALPAELFFASYAQHAQNLTLALNIKADGLQKLLSEALSLHQIQNYFVFDMSVPDMISYINSGIRVFTRQSEYEPNPALYEQAHGVWIDCFNEDWVDEHTIETHINNGKQVCLVSPDLHKRTFETFWTRLKKMPISKSFDLMLCTDYPEEARNYFHE
jgi:glycerophosphoryl diester phosphodiesterase